MFNRLSLRDNKGASSIMVIIMMVVLLVFGLAILTTSLSNQRLAQRKQNWLSEYYGLEGKAQEEIALFDGILIDAEAKTRSYLESDTYMDDYMLDLPLDDRTYPRIYALVYNDYAIEGLSKAIAGRSDAVLYHVEPDFFGVLEGRSVPTSKLEFSVAMEDGNYGKHIQITMELLAANSENLTDDHQIINRYSITRHTQQQEPFQYDDSLDFENPFDEEDGFGNPFGE